MPRHRLVRPPSLWLLVACALAAAACASPVGVQRVGPEVAQRALTANVLSAGELSAYSSQVLQRLDLAERFKEDPAAAIAALQATLEPEGHEHRIFALAEMSFLHAETTKSRSYYLAAAVYAYAFLFPGAGPPPGLVDPRVRLAADLYNRGLTEGLAEDDGETVRLAPRRETTPFGELEIRVADDQLVWAGRRLEAFVPAARLAVHGLRNRYRQAGLGAPLAASLGPSAAGAALPAYSRIPSRLKVPVTVLLRLPEARLALVGGRVSGVLELYSKDDRLVVDVEGHQIPLEFESSAVLAYSMDRAPIWESEIRGFLRGDYLAGGGGQLWTLSPYRPGRIPVVLVHGTASSPLRWAELVNELDSDPRIGPRVQFWLFTYNTGNPMLYSGGLLHDALRQTVDELDPGGTDAALRRMVVIGHSQGGLLTRLQVVDSGTRFWDNLSQTPLAALRFTDSTRRLLQRSLFFTPLPSVRRVVFLATPHRGSDVAGFLVTHLRRLIMWGIELPAHLVKATADVLSGAEDPLLRRILLEGLPRSVENMSPGNRAIRTLQALPIADGVIAHSIIAVQGDGPVEEGNDGVVSYHSAHLDGVASELVVRSGHSVQSHPAAIEEIRRILLEHLD